MQRSPAAEAHLSRVESFVVEDKVDAGCRHEAVPRGFAWKYLNVHAIHCNVWVKISGKEREKSRQAQMPMLGSAIYHSNKKRQLGVTLGRKITLCLGKASLAYVDSESHYPTP